MKKSYFSLCVISLLFFIISGYLSFHIKQQIVTYTISSNAIPASSENYESNIRTLDAHIEEIDTLQKDINDSLNQPTETPIQ